jgi:alginate O-acetyltransferase complex protein AlgJ
VPPRTDVNHQAFYRILAEQGVRVLDLADDFILARRDDEREGPVYCMTDTHWSSRACAIAAKRVRERVEGFDWFRGATRRAYATGVAEVAINGDLVVLSGQTNRAQEKIKLFKVGVGENLDKVLVDESSPVLLLADSHGLVFSEGGDLHGNGAGFADHLAHELGFSVDVMARRGSAATSVRLDLARRFIKDESSRSAKKFVIWCFTERDFTESSGWRKVPLQGSAKK